MQQDNLILVSRYCSLHDLDQGFITELYRYELIEIITIEQEDYLDMNRLNELERITRLHHDLGINIEGIEAIVHLLDKMEQLNRQMLTLRQRLKQYE
ncbi:chaperone modulator CbpM [Edaphocola flava]|jgi:DNA-binding transcriptional MerR regulator|uniref:chaperone modulator CbpM n=1 Tax=Edaphocola flava TaxID=2499629 RepID=UPI00100B0E8D|nr:chaperone modulator CbpM [Edaphocola flava]